MTSDLDIYRSANILVKQHGEDAPIHAAMRADAMLEAGDLDSREPPWFFPIQPPNADAGK